MKKYLILFILSFGIFQLCHSVNFPGFSRNLFFVKSVGGKLIKDSKHDLKSEEFKVYSQLESLIKDFRNATKKDDIIKIHKEIMDLIDKNPSIKPQLIGKSLDGKISNLFIAAAELGKFNKKDTISTLTKVVSSADIIDRFIELISKNEQSGAVKEAVLLKDGRGKNALNVAKESGNFLSYLVLDYEQNPLDLEQALDYQSIIKSPQYIVFKEKLDKILKMPANPRRDIALDDFFRDDTVLPEVLKDDKDLSPEWEARLRNLGLAFKIVKKIIAVGLTISYI